MNFEDLSTYLNDHLAGSVAALELVDDLLKKHAGKPLEEFFRKLHDEIEADQAKLRDLMRMCEVKEGGIRKVGAWVAEKLGRTKFSLSGEDGGELGLLQALEGLVLGITGKQLLWRAMLESSAHRDKMDFTTLEKRALEQHDRVEIKRLDTAREVFRAN